MAKEEQHIEAQKTVTDLSEISSISPGNEETVAKNIQGSRVDPTEELTLAKTNQSDAEPDYPGLKELIPAVLALYLALFLVALVCATSLTAPLQLHV